MILVLALLACGPTMLGTESETAIPDTSAGLTSPALVVDREIACDEEYARTYTFEIETGARPGLEEPPRLGIWSRMSSGYARYAGADEPYWLYTSEAGSYTPDGKRVLSCTWVDYGETAGFAYDLFVVLREP